MSTREPSTAMYCPVCETPIVFVYIWQDPDSSRIRMFCEECSHKDGYRDLPKNQRTIYSYEGFQRFAGRRLLGHVLERERDKRRAAEEGVAPKEHIDD
jgi:hypothetical protein